MHALALWTPDQERFFKLMLRVTAPTDLLGRHITIAIPELIIEKDALAVPFHATHMTTIIGVTVVDCALTLKLAVPIVVRHTEREYGLNHTCSCNVVFADNTGMRPVFEGEHHAKLRFLKPALVFIT